MMVIWDLGDGVHVGRLGVVLADGRLGVPYEAGGVVVEGVSGHHHRHPERPGFEIVPETQPWDGGPPANAVGRTTLGIGPDANSG